VYISSIKFTAFSDQFIAYGNNVKK